MKALERFLSDWSFLLRLILCLFCFFWAMQFSIVIRNAYVEQRASQKNKNPEKEFQASRQINELMDKKVKRAEEMGMKYGPKDYFQDLKEMEEVKAFDNGYVFNPFMKTSQLMQIVNDNVKAGVYASSEIDQASDNYREWKGDKLADREGFKKEMKAGGWVKILHWIFTFYWRSMFLVLFVFLIRMAEEKGILATVLAGKGKFLLSLVLWPFYFSRYPYNVVRRIVVEAEHRRLGSFFRILSDKERATVILVADGDEYRGWIRRFRERYAIAFERSFVLALLAAVFFNLFVPIASPASTLTVKEGGGKAVSELAQLSHGNPIWQQSGDSQNSDSSGSPMPVEPASLWDFQIVLREICRLVVADARWKKGIPRDVYIVPRLKLFDIGSTNRTAINGGIKCEFFLLSLRSWWEWYSTRLDPILLT